MKIWILILSVVLLGCAHPSKKVHDTKAIKPKANHLINETSPYLKQHAYNPVEWYPWGDEALNRAKKEDKLLLISIGYSACHWCHVMEHESFEDSTVAALMNKYFINIKIDREERPDIDQVYMNAVQLMNKGRGGWPLNAIALPDGGPLFGGTYFPKDQWINILKKMGEVYPRDKEKAEEFATKIKAGIQANDQLIPNEDTVLIKQDYLFKTIEAWKATFDGRNGGPNRAPKFPLPNNLEFLIDYGILAHDRECMSHVELTLDKMAKGGIYDQVGGGFARYSVDKVWKVPHFEKMLYDNAQLISLYSKAYRFYKKEEYRHIVVQSIDFLQRELKGEKLYYSALDADSEGEEGKFYVWNIEELREVFDTDFEQFSVLYNINEKGLWEHGNYILQRDKTYDELTEVERDFLSKVNQTLLNKRAGRVRPGLDNKSIVSWNALLLSGYVEAYNAFGDKHYLEEAKWISNNIKQLCFKEGKLFRILNKETNTEAFLDDYVFWAEGLVKLYECTFDETYLLEANELIEIVNSNFSDPSSPMFYYYSKRGEQLIHRPKEITDNVIPSSNSALANVFHRLGIHLGNKAYEDQSKEMLLAVQLSMERYGSGYSNWLKLANNAVYGTNEVVFGGPNALAFRADFVKRYSVNTIIAGSVNQSELPLLENRITEETFIYVCRDGACKLPVQKVEEAFNSIISNIR
jgi:uncharacterized protein YyaL (SSP411 family)